MRLREHFPATLALILAVIAFLAVNLAAGLTLGSLRFDLTADRIYTLSPVTSHMLGTLKEPVRLRFYVSPSLIQISGQYSNYAEHVRELLDVYARKSHGKVSVEFIQPEAYSPEEDRAVGFGLRGVPVDSQGNQAFFGLVGTNSTDQTETIPFLAPEREVFLEYDLTKMIAALATPVKPVIGLMDGAGTSSKEQGQVWSAVDQVRQLFTVRMIPLEADRIDPTVSVLIIVHPKNLSPATLFAIDQYIVAGGHALVFVDPDAESVAPPMSELMNSGISGGGASDMPILFKAWGIVYNPAKIAADWDQAMRIEAESNGRTVVTEFPPYIAVKPPYLKTDDPVTGDLKIINMVTSGALMQKEGATTVFTPLIQTSPHAALADVADAAINADPLAFISKYKPGNETLTLAARIVGPIVSAYPEGPPKDPHAAKPPVPGPYLKEAVKPAEIIVAADVDMLSDHSWVEMRDMMGQRIAMPFASNGDFVINALESLTGSTALSSLRARGVASRPLSRVQELQRIADDRYQATAESLSQKLDETRRQLLTLSAPKSQGVQPAGVPVLSDEQQEAVKRFRSEMVETRQQLRDVQRDLRHDIDRLETRIKILNIVVMPMTIVVFALLVAFGGIRRRK